MSNLILPGDPEFDFTLATSRPPNWLKVASQNLGEVAFVARADSGIMEAVNFRDLEDYLNGGEYDERMEDIEFSAY